MLAFVLCARDDRKSLFENQLRTVAQGFGIPFTVVQKPNVASPQRHRKMRRGMEDWRVEFETRIVDALWAIDVDIVVLCGYMLIAGEVLRSRYTMINLHPALPQGPKGTRQSVINQIISGQERTVGGMVHIVTNRLDRGRGLTYFRVPLSGPWWDDLWSREGSDLFNAIENEIVSREPNLLVNTIKVVSELGLDKLSPQFRHLWPREVHIA
jgi:phosphoribosylglycinamide formyltransferase-1